MRLSSASSRLIAVSLVLSLSLSAFAAEKPQSSNKAAFLKSFVIPGWGQYSLGRKNAALTFFGAELMLVGGMFTLNAYGRSTRADYQALAAAYAGVKGSHSHDFYVDVGNWTNTDQFNQRRLQQRQFDALYTDPADQWAWDSDAHRSLMETNRIRSDRAFNSVLYLVGGLVLNHIASAIHAGRMAALDREQSATPKTTSWNVDVQTVAPSKGLAVRFTHDF
ncbi:MAG TPA: hypothetical protein VGL38_02770 [bacterium]|jgi:hypothetical protein